ncbi:hypothetical protein BHE74_00006417 [Ensete ventricosum]|nr:hypothetical protein GW17_00006274 [Ensete ventricosum]RWW84953.1 hypothetical protein BHE74_00006417 [Ensete ventricosum]
MMLSKGWVGTVTLWLFYNCPIMAKQMAPEANLPVAHSLLPKRQAACVGAHHDPSAAVHRTPSDARHLST